MKKCRKLTDEEFLYRTIEARMDLPFDYARVRSHTEEAVPCQPILSVSRRRRAPVLAAVAATLAVVCALGGTGAWIAHRRDHSERPVFVPTPEETAVDSLYGDESESDGRDTDLFETREPTTVPPAPPETELETTVSAREYWEELPDRVTIRGVIYHKTKNAVSGEQIEGRLAFTIPYLSGSQKEITVFQVRGYDADRVIAILSQKEYVLYVVEMPETAPRSLSD